MIRTVIFDIGNVLTHFGWRDFLHSFGFEKEVEERIAKATIEHPFWNEFDIGTLDEEEMLAGFIRNDPSVEEQIRRVYANLHGIVTRADYAIPWIRRLKEEGYRVLVLSNFSAKVERENQDALDFLAYVDGGILSYQEGLIKPDQAVYQRLLERYELVPEECVFLDDVQENVDAAVCLGIHGILFQNELQAKEELKKLGVG